MGLSMKVSFVVTGSK